MIQIHILEDFILGIKDKISPDSIVQILDKILKAGAIDKIKKEYWFEYLDITSRPEFLEPLGEMQLRAEWAEQVFKIIQHCEFSLLDLFNQRVNEIPDNILFQDMSKNPPEFWTYSQVNRLVSQMAAAYHSSVSDNPRLAIYSENCVQSALTDLACLFYDIFDTPLSTHFKVEILTPIFDELKINIAVCDTTERLATLIELKKLVKEQFIIFTFDPDDENEQQGIRYIGDAVMLLSKTDVDQILAKRIRKPINQVITTMFTSGSTGLPKGVSFSIYNLVSKRFARHAALPSVGRNEVLLCFLPLFHTFGRFLELLGSIYWRGCYTFAGNPSPETLIGLFPTIRPTGFISVPIRWIQIYEFVQDKILDITGKTKISKILKSIVGDRLKWGLSAAGYLDPKIFTFFEKNGIYLCSGFGMTEATGGITMTPPGNYRKRSTGILLPGVKSKLIENGELILTGHYLARYLEDKGPDDIIQYPPNDENDYWLKTGDVFTITEDGYYEIIDRVKDIYKNIKGQTIAPKSVEKKFEGVPGIKQTFLVGDGKPFNVLLIVPDFHSPIIKKSIKEGNLNEYFHQIVMSANKDLANFERVVNFSILSRDFSSTNGEVTPKGSYNRKIIQNHYKGLIESLYQTNHIKLRVDGINILIPRWLYRDIGILENDIIPDNEGILDRRNNKRLEIKNLGKNQFLIGDFIYTISDDFIDIGRLARQPRLWVGNSGLIDFVPVKEGWDLPLKNISQQVYRLYDLKKTYNSDAFPKLHEINDSKLRYINELACKAIFCDNEIAIPATKELGQLLSTAENKHKQVIKRRLESLARHHEENVRGLAYKSLILAEPDPDFDQIFPAFVYSGLSFLTEESINEIAKANIGKQQLISLRKRLYYYRTNMQFPTTDTIRDQFKNTLKLLFNFGCNNISYYMSVRSEMASWVLHKNEPELSALAESYFFKLFENFDNWLRKKIPRYTLDEITERVVYETGITEVEINKLNTLFVDSLFLDQSVILAFEDLDFNLFLVPKHGMWISRLMSFHDYKHYRLSINTIHGKHYELHMVVSKEPSQIPDFEQLFWFSSLSGHPFGINTLPALGCSRLKFGIRTTKYLGELTVWEKIKEYAEIDSFVSGNIGDNEWRKLFIKAFSVFFITLRNSNFRIIPGSISPNNVVIPGMDFRETASIVTLSGMKAYEGPASIIRPMVKEFYERTEAHYPWVKDRIRIEWIFDACHESFDPKALQDFFKNLSIDLENHPIIYSENKNLSENFNNYKQAMNLYYLPLALFNAVDRYKEWENRNTVAGVKAKEQTIFELHELYKLTDYPQVVRYYLFRNTYFKNSDKILTDTFDALIAKMREIPSMIPIHMTELSELQNLMDSPEDKLIFSKMVFPRLRKEQNLDILRIKADSKEQIIIRSKLKNKTGEEFDFREPLEPSEIGQLYQLFYKENFPLSISKMDRHFVICDQNEKIIGGLCYKLLEDNTVVLNGSVINSPVQGSGLGTAMIEDFFTRMASLGVKLIKAHFLLGNYYLKSKLKADKKWGAFVKYL